MLIYIQKICKQLNINYQFVKFLFVGVINTIFSYAVFSVFIFLKFHYVTAAFISLILSILFNFKTTGNIVFKNNDNRLIIKFFMAYIIVYLTNIVELKAFTIIGMMNMYINYGIFVIPNAILSFFIMKKFVFNKKDKQF